MLPFHRPSTQGLTRLQEIHLLAQELYSRDDRHSFSSCPAFLDAQGGLMLLGQFPAPGRGKHGNQDVPGQGPHKGTCLLPPFQGYKVVKF